MLYLTSTRPYSITLLSGRTDIGGTLFFAPDTVMKHSDIVNTNTSSSNYNASLIDHYISKNILSLISITEKVNPPTTVSLVSNMLLSIAATGTGTFSEV